MPNIDLVELTAIVVFKKTNRSTVEFHLGALQR